MTFSVSSQDAQVPCLFAGTIWVVIWAVVWLEWRLWSVFLPFFVLICVFISFLCFMNGVLQGILFSLTQREVTQDNVACAKHCDALLLSLVNSECWRHCPFAFPALCVGRASFVGHLLKQSIEAHTKSFHLELVDHRVQFRLKAVNN